MFQNVSLGAILSNTMLSISDISILVAWLAIFVALFAFGSPYMSPETLARIVTLKKHPTDEDILMARRFLATLGALGYIGFYVCIALLAFIWATPYVNVLSQLIPLPFSPFLRGLFWRTIIGVLATVLVWLLFRCLWCIAARSLKKHPEPNPTESNIGDINQRLDKVVNRLDTLISATQPQRSIIDGDKTKQEKISKSKNTKKARVGKNKRH